jgi:hypothetical protein
MGQEIPSGESLSGVPSCVPPACACVLLKSTRAFFLLSCVVQGDETRRCCGAMFVFLTMLPPEATKATSASPARAAPPAVAAIILLLHGHVRTVCMPSYFATLAPSQGGCHHLPPPLPLSFASADCSSLTGGKRPRADWWLTTCKRSILYIRESSLRQCTDSPHGRRRGAEQPGHTLPETPFTLPRCTPAGQKMGALPAR